MLWIEKKNNSSIWNPGFQLGFCPFFLVDLEELLLVSAAFFFLKLKPISGGVWGQDVTLAILRVWRRQIWEFSYNKITELLNSVFSEDLLWNEVMLFHFT